MQEVLIERMTSPQIGAAIEAGATTVVVAAGAVEQHGPHLPLFMDAEHGTELAVRVALRLGNALVAPTIRVGCSEHHMAFAGTVSLRKQTFQAICLDYVASLARHGFTHICIIPSHGGNFAPLVEILPALGEAAGSAARVSAFTDLQAQIDVWKRAVEEEAGLGSRVGGHADIAESSIMLVLHEDLVNEAEAEAGYGGDLTPDVLRRLFSEGIGGISPNGILGDARGMSSAIGERCIAATVDLLVATFRASQQPVVGRTA
jgi:creatinine amidohydrolase